jgi:hypothetical protein
LKTPLSSEVSRFSVFFFFFSQRRNPDKSGREGFFATWRLGEKLKSFRVVIKNVRKNEIYLCGHGLHTSEATAKGNPHYLED